MIKFAMNEGELKDLEIDCKTPNQLMAETSSCVSALLLCLRDMAGDEALKFAVSLIVDSVNNYDGFLKEQGQQQSK